MARLAITHTISAAMVSLAKEKAPRKRGEGPPGKSSRTRREGSDSLRRLLGAEMLEQLLDVRDPGVDDLAARDLFEGATGNARLLCDFGPPAARLEKPLHHVVVHKGHAGDSGPKFGFLQPTRRMGHRRIGVRQVRALLKYHVPCTRCPALRPR